MIWVSAGEIGWTLELLIGLHLLIGLELLVMLISLYLLAMLGVLYLRGGGLELLDCDL